MANIKKIIFLSIPVFLVFSGLELGLRLSPLNEYLSPEYRSGSQLDHCVFWKPEPLDVNPQGLQQDYKTQFRGLSYQKQKPSGLLRIICLGGSTTWGWPLKDTGGIYPALLEKMLNQYSLEKGSSKRFEVINAGVGGYSSFQDLMYLKNSLLEYEPDIVTIYTGANDSSNNSDIHIIMTDKEYWEYLKKKCLVPLTRLEIILGRVRDYLANFRVYNAVDEIVYRLRSKPKRRVPLPDFKENLKELVALSKTYGFTLFFITEAHRSPDAILRCINMQKRFADMHDNVFFVDTRPFLEDNAYFIDQVHPTYEGHKVIARVVFDSILKSGVLDKEL